MLVLQLRRMGRPPPAAGLLPGCASAGCPAAPSGDDDSGRSGALAWRGEAATPAGAARADADMAGRSRPPPPPPLLPT